jgi:hypothetical protein
MRRIYLPRPIKTGTSEMPLTQKPFGTVEYFVLAEIFLREYFTMG